MKNNNIALNVSTAIVYEIVAIVAGLILPRLILVNFGSTYNGIVTSITQFLSFVVLARSGIGGVSKVFLYKSLSENDINSTSATMHATNDYMKKVSVFFLIALIILSVVYPFIVHEDWIFTFCLVLICGLSSLAENYFGVSSMILLQADRKEYIISISNIIVTILNVFVAYALISFGSIFGSSLLLVVKLGTALVFCIKPFFLFFFIKKKYHLDDKAPYDKTLLRQKKDAFVHVLAEFIHRNTDIIVLTFFAGPIVVSIYGVYAIVTNGLRKLTGALTSNFEAVLGKEYCKEDKSSFLLLFNRFNFITVLISVSVYLICACLFCSFINVYTKDINDANYIIPSFAILLCVGEFFDLLKTPYQFAIRVAGKFKETKFISVIEAALNIVVSIVLVNFFGIIGVAIGTVVAMFWRYIAYFIYCKKVLINISLFDEARLLFASLTSICLAIVLFLVFKPGYADSYYSWIVQALVVFLLVMVVMIVCFSTVCFKETKDLLTAFIRKFKRKESAL